MEESTSKPVAVEVCDEESIEIEGDVSGLINWVGVKTITTSEGLTVEVEELGDGSLSLSMSWEPGSKWEYLNEIDLELAAESVITELERAAYESLDARAVTEAMDGETGSNDSQSRPTDPPLAATPA
jgi:hypothetical protein